MEAILARPAFELVRATSGRAALELLEKNDFALILLDVQMPEMDGFETARLIRGFEKDRSTPIIFVTAMDRDKKHSHRAYSLGAIDFLYKPIDAEALAVRAETFEEMFCEDQQLLRTGLLAILHGGGSSPQPSRVLARPLHQQTDCRSALRLDFRRKRTGSRLDFCGLFAQRRHEYPLHARGFC